MTLTKLWRILLVAGAAQSGCANESMRRPSAAGPQEEQQQTLGRAELRPVGESSARGTVVVREQQDGKLHVKGRIRGLEPNSSHVVLLNPAGECAPRASGDEMAVLGTVTADRDGIASLSVTREQAAIGVPAEVIGSSLIVREGGEPETGEEPVIGEAAPSERPGMSEAPSTAEEPAARPEPGVPEEPIEEEPQVSPGELEAMPGQTREMEACAVIVPETPI